MTITSALDEAYAQLEVLCRRLGDPARDFVILGEGNAGVLVDGAQLVTASGSRLASITRDEFVRLNPDKLLAALTKGYSSDESWAESVRAAQTGNAELYPTIESPLHVVASALTGWSWTAHTHPSAVTGVLSSDAAATFAQSALFPDQIVINGPVACYLPYTDPGFPLANAFHRALVEFEAEHARWPRLVLLGNHGMVAMGASANEVFEITLMTEKAARIFTAAASSGRPVPLTSAAVARIDTRPDEEHRRRILRQVETGRSQ